MQKSILKSICCRAIHFYLLIMFGFVGQCVIAQQIKGVVTDEDGVTLPGVNIIEKGTNNGVVSDFDGNYTISVQGDDAILVFRYLGFASQEQTVKGKTTINVVMKQSTENLDEVVLIGYGAQRKGDVNSAISSVKGDALKDLKQINADQMLQGKVSGVTITNSSGQPGAASSVKIRGITSISGTNEPLYVIDGVPISGDAVNSSTSGRPIVGGDFTSQGNNSVSPLALLNPNDIESVDVLKDASATAIYGSRGANGVIIITTKSGKRGTGKITYDTYTGFQDIPKLLDVMDLQQYAKLQNALADVNGQQLRPEFSHPELLGKGTNWQEEVTRSAIVTSHQLSISGGKEGVNYYLSGGYLDQRGTVIGSGLKRYNVKLNLEAQVKEWLKAGAFLSGSITNQDVTTNSNYNGILTNTLLQAPDIPVRNLDGSFAGPPSNDQAVTYFNPVALALSKTNKLVRKNFLGNLFAEADLFEGLKYRVEFGASTEFSENNEFTPTYEWGTNINEFADLNVRRQNWYSTNLKNLFTYNKSLDKHRITVLLGNEVNDNHWEGIIAYGTGFLSNDVQTLNVSDGTSSTVTGYQGSQGLLSFFGRVIYDFNDRYSLSASYRADGSTKFDPNVPGKQWGYFPAAAISWKLSNESFMEGFKSIMDNIKISAGYGETGNQQIPNNRYTSTLTAYGSGLGTGFLVDNISNPNLTWESQVQTNLGLGFTLLDSRVSANVDLYEKKSKDFLFPLPLPLILTGGQTWEGGIASPYKNIGDMRNKGFDATLSYKTIEASDFSWDTSLNVSHYENEVTSIPNSLNLTGVINTNGYIPLTVTKTAQGQPIGMFYGYEVEGIFRDMDDLNSAPIQFGQAVGQQPGETFLGDIKYRDINGDGSIDEEDRTYIGNPHPDFTFGFTNNFKYKNIDLSIFLQGSYGNDVLNLTRRSNTTNSTLYQNQLAIASDFWTPENPDASLPRPIGSASNSNLVMSDRYLEDGSYLRIQNLTLGYSLPLDVISKFNVNRLRVYGSVQNLYTFTNYSGYDPEVGSVNQNPLLNGIDNGRYPASRTISFGLNLEF
ncbi:MAG: TonB-dependent receptor [Bacteroidota bacterium]|uniref:TonB-dependent receptor n=1 Tax=Flagellimonas profundi TaxID=2915620 RepID=A0ABS3FK84_9FLAO|nr:TonB-dependent receptor [Allomuricauda profundi]MBO0343448.1 TonB-dependent receptor [Allomuricauda profundi]MEC7772316.1 TonB-dependent receptor [Bacteroidota bacterium]